jgi:site-specific recombinase XerC
VIEAPPPRITLPAALDASLDYVRGHRSLRTFRTYRPMLASFKAFCTKTYVDQVERQDLLDFATQLMKQGQKGKSIYNKLVAYRQLTGPSVTLCRACNPWLTRGAFRQL